jgi:hypothetical protein
VAGTVATLACIHLTVYTGSHEPEPDVQARSVPRGQSVTIDGNIAGSEWQDADSVSVVVGDSVNATVRFKHDGSSLLVAFVFRRVHGVGMCFAEMLLDLNHDRGQTLLPDDWWLHVSASMCEARGRIDDYSLCRRSADWSAARLYPLGDNPTPVDTIEVRIPFAKLGMGAGRVFGLAFRVDYEVQVGGVWRGSLGLWPSHAGASTPSTWGTFRIAD